MEDTKLSQRESHVSASNRTNDYGFDDSESEVYTIADNVKILHVYALHVFYSGKVNDRFNKLKAHHLGINDGEYKKTITNAVEALKASVKYVSKSTDRIFETSEWKDCEELLGSCSMEGKYKGCIHHCRGIINTDGSTSKVKYEANLEFIQELKKRLHNLLHPLSIEDLIKNLSLKTEPQIQEKSSTVKPLVEDPLVEAIWKQFADNIKNIISRKTLGSTFSTIKIKDDIDLLAHVRLFNLSQEREIKNAEDQKMDNEQSCTKIIIFRNESRVKEKQRIIKYSYGRVDWVIPTTYTKSESCYSGIFNRMDGLLKQLNKTDRYIVTQIRAFLGKGELDSYSSQMSALCCELTYLLFGTEVARNPGCILLHQMMLDLIEHGAMLKIGPDSEVRATFKIFFESMLMPMAMTAAVSAARIAYIRLEPFLPKSYKYFGPCLNDNTFKQLFEKEASLINWWLQSIPDEKEFTSAIQGAIQKWYGIDLRGEGKKEIQHKYNQTKRNLKNKSLHVYKNYLNSTIFILLKNTKSSSHTLFHTYFLSSYKDFLKLSKKKQDKQNAKMGSLKEDLQWWYIKLSMLKHLRWGIPFSRVDDLLKYCHVVLLVLVLFNFVV
ncbi:hypothetical protein RFI_26278, partial [Reticulomyxa filosa]